jgi:hypothetical protein
MYLWNLQQDRILCAHGLKVLDLMNIKTLPTHYVFKRWTKEAQKEVYWTNNEEMW